jgi:hypothetical protein
MRLRDDEINMSDIPEIKDWSKAAVGKFYRSGKIECRPRAQESSKAFLTKP